MTPITKTTYIDNFGSDITGCVEIGYRNKKAFIRHDTLEIINTDNIPLNLRAMALGICVADNYNRKYQKSSMTFEQAKNYLKKEKTNE